MCIFFMPMLDSISASSVMSPAMSAVFTPAASSAGAKASRPTFIREAENDESMSRTTGLCSSAQAPLNQQKCRGIQNLILYSICVAINVATNHPSVSDPLNSLSHSIIYEFSSISRIQFYPTNFYQTNLGDFVTTRF
jgi:hypothetical protein